MFVEVDGQLHKDVSTIAFWSRVSFTNCQNQGRFIYIHSRYIVQILVHSHFDLALEATEPVYEPVTQTTVELINIHLISVKQKG